MGDLSQETLADIIRNLYAGRTSGILHLSRDGIQKRIYFRKGSMIFANSDVDSDRLGEFLIRQGRIDRQAFELATKVMKDTGRRFGRTIVEMGYMTPEDMQSVVVQQIEAIIYSLFEWEAGEHRFEPHESPVDEDIVLNLSTADIIVEGTRRMRDFGAIRRALGDLHRTLRHSENPLLLYQKISLTPSEGFVLSRVDSMTTVADITAISPLGEEATLRCIYGLVSAGVLNVDKLARPSVRPEPKEHVDLPKPEAVPLERDRRPKAEAVRFSREEQAIRDDVTRKHASLATATFYDLLGITMTGNEAEIRRAYYAMAKKYHPDRHHSPYLQDVHGLLEELFVKITKAYQLLSNPVERRRYDASLRTEAPRGEMASSHPIRPTPGKTPGTSPSEKMAEMRYREGKRYYEEMSYFDSIQCLREAVRLDPGKVTYRKLLASALSKNPHWLKEAEEQLKGALELDGFDIECYLGLGEIYEKSGMTTRAQKMYQRAVELDPQSEIAREKLHGKKIGAMDGLKTIFGRKKP